MGTVSLKNIEETSAEFGITIRACAMGKGYSIWAMNEILKIAFEEKRLQLVYWCVSPDNKRAVRFYDKNEFERVDAQDLDMITGYTQEQIDAYVWYLVKNPEN
jgi:diamine N-acetyltransferase